MIAHVDVSVNAHILRGGLDVQQAHFGLTQIALTHDAVDHHTVGGQHVDGAARGRVQSTARDVVTLLVEHQGADQDRHFTAVGARGDGQSVVGRDQAIDQNLAA